MIDYIKAILPNIQAFSSSLNKKAIFLNHPWVIVNEEGEKEKLIFQRNGNLLISKVGDVKTGKWEYLSHLNSLLIVRGIDRKLYNQAFIDNGIMVLKLDGTSEDYIMLANESVIPDLNIKQYLTNKYYFKVRYELPDGRSFRINKVNRNHFSIGDELVWSSWRINDEVTFFVANEKIIVKNSKVIACFRRSTSGRWSE